ncbi:MAG: LysM domain-containing protein [Chloroflexota bacterium]|nr:LysM domain-containing protein [Chloroflexota bacterium]
MWHTPWLLLIALSVFAVTTPIGAQDANLLRDGGMESAYTARGRADLNIPTEWSIWVTELPHLNDWMNLPPVAFPHTGPDPMPHLGARAFNLNKNFATFTAALYQQVTVTTGAPIRASAYAFVRTCNIPTGFDTCRSLPDSGAYTRIGLDPNGGTNPLEPDVVWSGNQEPHEAWTPMTVGTTATGSTVTVFLYTSQTYPRGINQVYWDDAFLSAGTVDAAAALPTAALEVGFVQPQGQGDDGSIVHLVQAGDTIDSIAVAYQLTRDGLLALNPGLPSTRFIRIGQAITVRAPEPTVEPSATPQPTTPPPATPAPTVTRQASAQPTATANPTQPPTATAAAAATEAIAALPTDSTSASTPEVVALAPTDAPSQSRAPVVAAADGVIFPFDPLDETASICVLMFEDGNANRLQDAGEELVTQGRITLALNGEIVAEHVTGDLDPTCIDNLTSALYLAQAEAPAGYGLTTAARLQVRTTGGAQIAIAFGAAPGIIVPTAPVPDLTPVALNVASTSDDDAPTRQIGLFVLAGAGVVFVGGLFLALLLRRLNG